MSYDIKLRLILLSLLLTKDIQFSVKSKYTNRRILLNSPGRMKDIRLFLKDKTSKSSTSSNTPAIIIIFNSIIIRYSIYLKCL